MLVAPNKQTCAKGHPFEEGNERRTRQGKYEIRICKTCSKAAARDRRKKISELQNPRLTRKGVRPDRAAILPLVKTLTWTAIGLRFGVSDVTARKWVKAYESPLSVSCSTCGSGVGEPCGWEMVDGASHQSRWIEVQSQNTLLR